jgi:ankyrin repeat protein
LYYAIDNQQENLDVVELLIQHEVNINKMTISEGCTPLMLAVKRGHQNIVKTLMI